MGFRIVSTSLVILLLVAFPEMSSGQNFWQSVSIPSITTTVNDLAISSSGTIFAATLGSGIYQSTDNGTTWTKDSTGGSYFYSLSISPNGTIFGGSYLGSIYRSTDNGTTWTSAKVGALADTANSIVTCFTYDGSGNVYVATGLNGIFSSSDEGVTWNSVLTNFMYPFAMAFDAQNNFLVGTFGDGMFTSPNAVSPTWNPSGFSIFSNYNVSVLDSLTIDSVYIDSVHHTDTTYHTTGTDSVVYIVTRYGVKAITHPLRADTLKLQIDSIHYARSIIKSKTALDTVQSNYFYSVNFGDFLRVNTIAAGADGQQYAGTDKGVCRRISYLDSSKSKTNPVRVTYWQEVTYPLGFQYILSLVATAGGQVYAATMGNGVFGSLDSGTTWAQVDTGITFRNARTTLAKSPAGYLYCGTAKGGIYKSKSPVSVEAPVTIEKHAAIHSQFVLEHGYPNPFNPTATIPFILNQSGRVSLKIYNTLGQLVSTLHDGMLDAGQYAIPWDASGFPSGVYFYRMQSASDVQTGKLVLMK